MDRKDNNPIFDIGDNGFLTGNVFEVKDKDQQPDNSKFVLFANGKRVGSIGNFVAITGKPKTRKTAFANAILSSAIIGGEQLGFGVRLPANKKNIVLIDTEQDSNDILYNLARLKNQLQIQSLNKYKNFKVYAANVLHSTDIVKLVNGILSEDKNIGLLVIDGLLDLIDDMNDIKESKYICQQLKQWAINNGMLIVGILHQSKSTGFSIGHLGSFIDRKAQAVLSVEKEKDDSVSTCSANLMRSDAPFNPISIQYSIIDGCYIVVN